MRRRRLTPGAPLQVSAHLGPRLDPPQLWGAEVGPVMEPNVLSALFGVQEVEAALGAAVGDLHLHSHIQGAVRDTHTHGRGVCVCVWNTWCSLKCCW